jgi:hypothetical protein
MADTICPISFLVEKIEKFPERANQSALDLRKMAVLLTVGPERES